MSPGDHDNYECSCLPHDMEVRLAVSFIKFIFKAMNKVFNFKQDGFYCYHYMNCINNNEYEIEVRN